MLSIVKRLPKPIFFGISAAIGCLIGAILGEMFLNAMQSPPAPHDVILLIDTSSSMSGGKLNEVKNAAKQFVERRHKLSQTNERIGVVGFSGSAYLVAGLTSDLMTLIQPIDGLNSGGGTAMSQGIQTASSLLSTDLEQGNIRSVLLFTDGHPNNPQATLNAGQSARDSGIQIIAVHTSDANRNLLEQVTGDPNRVFLANVGSFDKAFEEAEKALYGSVINSGDTTILTVAGWTAFLALGIGLALIISQNLYLRRRTIHENLKGSNIVGFIIAGIIAGGVAQYSYGMILTFFSNEMSDFSAESMLIRTVGWFVLGVLLGVVMAWTKSIPNLKVIRAFFGGGLGGIIGVGGFLLVGYYFSDETTARLTTARLLGATILGFFIGIMIAIAEKGKAYLEVHWGPKDINKIYLGEQPILVGSANNAHIYLPAKKGFPPEMGVFYIENDQIIFNNYMNKQKQVLKDGNKWKIDTVEIVVKVKSTDNNS